MSSRVIKAGKKNVAFFNSSHPKSLTTVLKYALTSSYEEVKAYFSTVVKDLGWEELKKATFFFPAFMTLEDISILLFSCMSQYVMNASL